MFHLVMFHMQSTYLLNT